MAKLIGTRRPRLRHRVFAYLEAAVPLVDSPERSIGTWRWLFADEAGVAIAGPAVCFTSGEVAENWLTAQAPRLHALGVAAVTLLDGEHAVYGPATLPWASR